MRILLIVSSIAAAISGATAASAQVVSPELADRLASAPEGTRIYASLELDGELTPAARALLAERSIRVHVEYAAGLLRVSLPAGLDFDRGLLHLIRSADLVPLRQKLGPGLRTGEIYPWARVGDGDVRLQIQFQPGVGRDAPVALFRELGIAGRRYGPSSWATVVPIDLVREIANRDEVRHIQQGPLPFVPLTDSGRARTGTERTQRGKYFLPRPLFALDGSGAAIGIFDSGIDSGHDDAGVALSDGHLDFRDIEESGTTGASRVTARRGAAGEHGTRVASIAAASGYNSKGVGRPAFLRRGHAPFAGLGDYAGGAQDLLAAFHAALADDAMDVTNHSYVQSWTTYDQTAHDLDLIVRGDAVLSDGTQLAIPARPQVWAAGNNGTSSVFVLSGGDEEGYTSVFTSAKNPISVGSIDSDTGRLSDFSSLGPTYDGRIKPDLMAPGCRDSYTLDGIWAAISGTQEYGGQCGTSMSAPVVSGVIALMVQAYTLEHGNAPELRPSTFKALLVHTAIDLVKTRPWKDREFENPDTGGPVLYYAGPDFATGWGLVDAEGATEAIRHSERFTEADLAEGDVHTRFVVVKAGAPELKVTIAWDDLPGAADAVSQRDAQLVNDLDLALITPNGARRHPWLLLPFAASDDPGEIEGNVEPVPAGRGADHRNNVEMVQEAYPDPGCWKVEVKATDLADGATQTVSLVASEKLLDACP